MKAFSFLAAAVIASTASAAGSSVRGSKHDLSVTGPGPIRAESEKQVCIFCHVPHGGGSRTLNARPDVGNTHQAYASSTLRTRAGAPTGASRICLSCHDGTIAVGKTRTRSIRMTGVTARGTIPATRRSNLGTDLRSTHPVSIPFAMSSKTHSPSDPHVKLEGSDVQCTSCHDPHSEFGGSPEGMFLVRPTNGSALCTSCHDVSRGAHATSAAPFTAAQGNEAGYGSVADAGCRACHRSHGADTQGRLLARASTDPDDATCIRCHDGSGPAPAVSRELTKPFSHAVDGGRAHDAAEGPDTVGHRLPETSPSAARHAVCVDCHEPHEAVQATAQAPVISGALRGAWGIDILGRKVDPARYEYEVCFKCHGDSANRPTSTRLGAPRRKLADGNLRQIFDPAAPSNHPVVTALRGGDVPSLTGGYRAGSLVYCTDCHASDDGPGAGGKGPRGPHGSIYAPLLERNYTTGSVGAESPFAYALCYKCHDRDVLLSSRSAFPLHRRHVVDQQTPCSVCHSAHGVSATAGNPLQNAHLIDFDLNAVRPGRAGLLEYDRRGVRSGSCTLTCHGAVHDGRSY